MDGKIEHAELPDAADMHVDDNWMLMIYGYTSYGCTA